MEEPPVSSIKSLERAWEKLVGSKLSSFTEGGILLHI